MNNNFISIDFEYKGTNQAKLNLVSVAIDDGENSFSNWLHQKAHDKLVLKGYLLNHRDIHILLSFNVDAEARALIALGLNPTKFKWIDIQAEWKMLTNHCDKYGYGKHLIDGKVKVTSRKKRSFGKTKEKDTKAHDKPPVSLLSCTYKLLGNVGPEDYELKEKMRDLILHTEEYSEEDKKQILDYGAKDVKDLHALYLKIMQAYKSLFSAKERETLHAEMLWRGESVARAALIASLGYPVSREKVTNFTNNIPYILKEVQEDLNSQFPGLFRWDKKFNRYSLNTKIIKDWIASSEYTSKWERTPTEGFSLGLEAFEKHFHYRHDFPRDDLPAQFLRYLKVNQSLNGFRPKLKGQTFFDYYGDDDRAHPYLNAYGAQSSRYQPKAIGFIHLKAAWMRSMVEPESGYAIAAIDYSSEEFLISALVSEDEKMLAAYESGDVYLYFAKLAGAVPWEGKRKDYEDVRDAFKATVLALSYDMGPDALANKLTQDTGKPHTRAQAEDYISKFKKAFPTYITWRESLVEQYAEEARDGKAKIKLPCGWTMFGDNDNPRSIGNMPIQGVGACILRKAIQLCQDAGLKIILPLHDALYLEYPSDDVNFTAVYMMEALMREAFAFYFEGEMRQKAFDLIRMDIKAWSPDYGEGTVKNIKTQKVFIDGRSQAEYKRFSKYFSSNNDAK